MTSWLIVIAEIVTQVPPPSEERARSYQATPELTPPLTGSVDTGQMTAIEPWRLRRGAGVCRTCGPGAINTLVSHYRKPDQATGAPDFGQAGGLPV